MILVFGKTGQVARELARIAPAGTVFLSRDDADLAVPGACGDAVNALRPAAVINAVAWTGVDKAEAQEAAATRVNGDAPAEMARACARAGIPFVHISTDYVFDGAGSAPFRPDDPTLPLGGYGRSKLAGEVAVRAMGGPHAILRTSWVFSAHGSNFVKTMLKLSETRNRLTVVADQIGGPTPAAAIARALLIIAGALQMDPSRSGTYHFSGAPDLSWADFAREILAQAGRAVSVTDIPASAYPTPARRPANSRLDCSATEADFGIVRPNWRRDLTDVLAELGALT